MIEASVLLERVKQNPINLEELINIDLMVCESMIEMSEHISVVERDYADAFLQELDLGYKMTLTKAEWRAKQLTNSSYQRAQRDFSILQKVHEHLLIRIKSLSGDRG